MREIEVKVLDVDAEAVVRRILAAGARCDFDSPVHALYFDTPDRRISRRRDSLRLRREGTRAVLNFKAHVAEAGLKVRDELETDVGDFDAARRILLALGYEVWLEMEKHRRSFSLASLPGVHLVFDRHLGAHAFIPEYLEIEAPTREMLREAVLIAGFTMAQTVPWNAYEVAEHYRPGATAKGNPPSPS